MVSRVRLSSSDPCIRPIGSGLKLSGYDVPTLQTNSQWREPGEGPQSSDKKLGRRKVSVLPPVTVAMTPGDGRIPDGSFHAIGMTVRRGRFAWRARA